MRCERDYTYTAYNGCLHLATEHRSHSHTCKHLLRNFTAGRHFVLLVIIGEHAGVFSLLLLNARASINRTPYGYSEQQIFFILYFAIHGSTQAQTANC